MKVGNFLDRLAGAKTTSQAEKAHAKADTNHASGTPKVQSLPLTKFALILALIGVSFYLGTAYQKTHQPATARTLGTNGSSNSQNQQQLGMGGGFGSGNGSSGGYGRFGGSSMTTSQVTAVSTSSITVQDTTGNSQTYSIDSTTVITDSGQQVTTSDIQTGDSVIVIPERADTGVARRIIVNPDFGNQPTSIDPSQSQLN